MPTAREGRFILLLGALVAFGPLAIDLYLPAFPAIGASLAATPQAVRVSITVFLCGFALGHVVLGAAFAANACGIFPCNYLNSRLVTALAPTRLATFGSVCGLLGATLFSVGVVHDAVGLAGAEAALFGSSQFGLGMSASPAVSYAFDGSGRPMASVILAASALSSLAGIRFYRQRVR